MSIKIIIKSQDAEENVRLSRSATNKSNLEEDSLQWTKILNIDDNINCICLDEDPGKIKTYLQENAKKEDCIVIRPEKETVQATYYTYSVFKNGNDNYKIDILLSKVLSTISKRIWRKNSISYGLTSPTDVRFWMIKEVVNLYLQADEKIQLFFCRDATRQSVDELVQIETLKKYLSEYKIKKIKTGTKTVSDGEIKNDLSDVDENQFARSLDVEIVYKNKIFYGFVKYSDPIGSSTVVHQSSESKDFLKECIKYVNNNPNDNIRFFALTDGYAARSQLKTSRKIIEKYKNRIFIGKTSDIINWIKNLN